MALMMMASCRLSTAGFLKRPFVSFSLQALVLFELFHLIEQVVLVYLLELAVREVPLSLQLGEVGWRDDEAVTAVTSFPDTAPMSMRV